MPAAQGTYSSGVSTLRTWSFSCWRYSLNPLGVGTLLPLVTVLPVRNQLALGYWRLNWSMMADATGSPVGKMDSSLYSWEVWSIHLGVTVMDAGEASMERPWMKETPANSSRPRVTMLFTQSV